jgi:phospholipase C
MYSKMQHWAPTALTGLSLICNAAAGSLADVEHVVYFMQENRA